MPKVSGIRGSRPGTWSEFQALQTLVRGKLGMKRVAAKKVEWVWGGAGRTRPGGSSVSSVLSYEAGGCTARREEEKERRAIKRGRKKRKSMCRLPGKIHTPSLIPLPGPCFSVPCDGCGLSKAASWACT